MAYRRRPPLSEARRLSIETDLLAEKRKADLALKTLGHACAGALAAGFSTREIGELFGGVSPSTVGRWAKL